MGGAEIASVGVGSIAVSAVFAGVGDVVVTVIVMGAVRFGGAVLCWFRW